MKWIGWTDCCGTSRRGYFHKRVGDGIIAEIKQAAAGGRNFGGKDECMDAEKTGFRQEACFHEAYARFVRAERYVVEPVRHRSASADAPEGRFSVPQVGPVGEIIRAPGKEIKGTRLGYGAERGVGEGENGAAV